MEAVKQRVALVVGASDEIGTAVALHLARSGARVIVCDSSEKELEAASARIAQQGCTVGVKRVDPASSSDVKRVVGEVAKEYGPVEILVNHSHARYGKPLGDATDEDWEASLRTVLTPVFYFCREVIPAMQAGKHGRVVNLTDLDYIGRPGRAGDSAPRSALFGLTRSLALETARDGVTVNCVVEGDVADSALSPEQAEKIGGSLPVKRIGRPEDVARAVGFFASEASGYMTGQMLFVCGGKSAHYSMSI